MERAEALKRIQALLEREGEGELALELQRVAAAAESAEAHTRTISEITRALLESEKTYRLVFSHEIDPMSLFDAATGKLLEVNDAWVDLYGYSREEALGMHVAAVSAEPAETKSAIAKLPAGSTTRINLRWHRAKNGTIFPVELTSGKLTLEGRQVAYAVMRDITQRDDAERRLARSVASYRTLIESMPDGVIVHRLGRVVYMNPSARRMLGYASDDPVEDVMVLDLVHPDDRPTVVLRMIDVIARGEPAPLLEERLLRKDGTSVVAEIATHGTVFEGEHAMLAIARDASARKEVEAKLVMNDRLASLGRLSASIGHELNNPLAYVLGNVELLSREIARASGVPPEVAERIALHLGMIREGAVQMRDIVRDLKRLARADVDQAGPVDVLDILEVCVKMAEREITPRARLVREFRSRATVLGTEASLGQVFLDLLLNAARSIEPGAPDENEVRIVVCAVDAGRVAVEIRDTGVGIAPEDRERIFEPFLGARQGEETGLALTICHRIVSSAGGSLTADANGGRGAVFRVVLPVVEDAP